ncbi:MAG: hypothetical protein WD894_06300 [Pirellulales bacterium]
MPHSQQTSGPPVQVTPDDFPLEELRKHRGHWVAFSADGRRLIASSTELSTLDVLVRTAGEDPEQVLLERIPDGEFIASGLELS